MAEACVFCRIGRGEIPSDILYHDERAFVIRDINPRAPKHLLVLPSEHVTYLASLRLGSGQAFEAATEPLLGHLMMVAGEIAKREGLTETGYRLVVNQGADSGQEVPHMHVHVLGGRRLGAMG